MQKNNETHETETDVGAGVHTDAETLTETETGANAQPQKHNLEHERGKIRNRHIIRNTSVAESDADTALFADTDADQET